MDYTVTESFSYSVIQSFSQSVSQSAGQSVSRSVGRSSSQPVSWSDGQLATVARNRESHHSHKMAGHIKVSRDILKMKSYKSCLEIFL